MKRKVIQLAGKTFVVSIPTEFAKANGVKKGDEVEVTTVPKGLLISTSSTKEEKIRVDVSGLSDDTVKRVVSMLFKCGYDDVELVFDKPETAKIIQSRLQSDTIGWEVIEQSAKMSHVKTVSKEQDTEMDSIIRRLFLVTLEMLRGFANTEGDKEHLLSLEKTNNKLVTYCHRLLCRNLVGRKMIFTYIITWNVEKVADILKGAINEGYVLDKKTKGFMQEYVSLFEFYYNLYYTPSLKGFSEFRKRNVDLCEKMMGLKCSSIEQQKIINTLFALSQKMDDCVGSTYGLFFS